MPGDNEELQTVAELKDKLAAAEYLDLEKKIKSAQEALENAKKAYQAATNEPQADGQDGLKQKRKVQELHQVYQQQHEELQELQASLATKKEVEEKLLSIQSQQQAVAILQELHARSGSLKIDMDPAKPIENEKAFQTQVEQWKEKAKDNDIGGGRHWLGGPSQVKFSRQPFSITTGGGSQASARAVAATALLMAKDCGVKAFSIQDGKPSQRQAVAQELLRAGHSDVKLSSGKGKLWNKLFGDIKNDKTWNAIFETKKSLESKGTAKDDFSALYEALGEKAETEHYSPESLQKKLVESLKPAQFAKMLENTKDVSHQEKMLGQLAETLKGKGISECQEYLKEMNPKQQYSLYEALDKKEDPKHSLQKTLIQALTPNQFVLMLEEANAVEQGKMLGQLAETLKGKAGPEWKKYFDEMDTPQQEMFAEQAALQLNKQFGASTGKQQRWMGSQQVSVTMINSIKDVFAGKDAADVVKEKFNSTLKLQPTLARNPDGAEMHEILPARALAN